MWKAESFKYIGPAHYAVKVFHPTNGKYYYVNVRINNKKMETDWNWGFFNSERYGIGYQAEDEDIEAASKAAVDLLVSMDMIEQVGEDWIVKEG